MGTILELLKEDIIVNKGGYVVAAAFWILIAIVLILLLDIAVDL